jgi:hypothetical protein
MSKKSWPTYLGTTSIGITSIRTEAQHTELALDKDRVRKLFIRLVQSDRRKPQGIVSISDGILSALAMLDHPGPFQGVDICPEMCKSINSHRPRPNKPEGDVPGLIILPALNMTWNQAIRRMCVNGDIRYMGGLDPDLTSNIQNLFPHVYQSFQDLADVKWKGWIALTGSRRGDGFRNDAERECYVRSMLPRGIAFVKCEPYSSNYQDRNRVYHRRDPMCQYIFQGRPVTKSARMAA